MTRHRRRNSHPPTLESLQAELRGLRVALTALGLAIVAVGVVVAVLVFSRAPRQKFVNDQLHTLTCLAVLRLPDTNPTARDLRAAYHCPPYAPPTDHRSRSAPATSSPPPAAVGRPAATRPARSSSSPSATPAAAPPASAATVARHSRIGYSPSPGRTPTVTVTPRPRTSTVTAPPSGLLAPLCNLAADLRIC